MDKQSLENAQWCFEWGGIDLNHAMEDWEAAVEALKAGDLAKAHRKARKVVSSAISAAHIMDELARDLLDIIRDEKRKIHQAQKEQAGTVVPAKTGTVLRTTSIGSQSLDPSRMRLVRT